MFKYLIPRAWSIWTHLSLLAAVGLSAATTASPWVEPGNELTRHHLQVLGDSGVLPQPLTSWPIMWSSVNQALQAVDTRALSDTQLWSYRYLKHELRRAQQTVTTGQRIYANSSHAGLTEFASGSREQLETQSYVAFTGDRWAFKLQGSAVSDPIDGQRFRLDGSYITSTWGNWAIGAGAVERWWGPGWQSSLILSNAARPSPGFFINRVDSRPFQWPVLQWLGPWDLRLFMNQLEGSRGTPHAKLFGMRATFKPVSQLEIGLSRVAQWGGDDRPQDFDTFWNLLIGNDNRGDGNINEDMSNEPGNQLGGLDWRLGHNMSGMTAAFYGQVIGEDEAGGLPSHVIGMAGIETSFAWGSTHNRFAAEASNTMMEFNKEGSPNSTYEHPLYPSGYRYRGRPLGASFDNDSEVVALKGLHSLAGGHTVSWTLGSGKINKDGGNRNQPGGNVFGADAVDLWYGKLQYSLPVSERGFLSVGGQYYSEVLTIRGEAVETGVHLSYEVRL